MRLLIFLAAGTLAGCTDPASNATNAQNSTIPAVSAPAEEPNRASDPVRNNSGSSAGNRQGPQPLPDDADQCGASKYQYLVGQPRSRIPEKPANAAWRVTCTSCPITMDYSPARLNIFYDEKTQIVEEVKCG
jgi:hypothetical protein